jgi:hypothetical protein
MPQHSVKNLPCRAMGAQPSGFWGVGRLEMRQCERDQMHSRLTDLEQFGEQAGLGVHHGGQRFAAQPNGLSKAGLVGR